uniref:Uncharacterized protein n=1 Tax=viral metagenome TaxID=1070528 RepID=A0A6H1ZGJ3_9ZZZZ
MEKVMAYKCDFCKDSSRRLFLSYSGCRKHEKKCWLNPARRSCATCENLTEVPEKVEPYGKHWRCMVRNDVTPFKGKISGCPSWGDSHSIFTNEEPNLDRPTERKRGVK